jgi:hypothetical protein
VLAYEFGLIFFESPEGKLALGNMAQTIASPATITTANIHCEGTEYTSSTSELQICHLQQTPAYESLNNWQAKFTPMNNNRDLDWNDCLMTDSRASLCVCPLNYRTECPLDTECQRPELHTASGDRLNVTGRRVVHYELGNTMILGVAYWVCNVKGPLVSVRSLIRSGLAVQHGKTDSW